MKQKLIRLSQHYGTALRTHLQPGARISSLPAQALGRQAAALGVETLELARMHEQALVSLDLSKSKNGALIPLICCGWSRTTRPRPGAGARCAPKFVSVPMVILA